MEFVAKNVSLDQYQGDALAVGLFEGFTPEVLDPLNQKSGGLLQEILEEEKFTGKKDSKITVRMPKGQSIKRLYILGLGKEEDYTLDKIRIAAASAARLAKSNKYSSLGLSLPLHAGEPAQSVTAQVEGASLAMHTFEQFKSKKKEQGNGDEEPEEAKVQLQHVAILTNEEKATAAIAKGESIVRGTILARELVSAPSNFVTPSKMAQEAQQIAESLGLGVNILDRSQCAALGMGAFLGVAQGSEEPPMFIHVFYKPEGTPRRRLAFVGKGVTFDTGGISIKPSSGMEMMKTDMAGAAACLGAMRVIGELKPDVEVHCVIPATDNMPSGKAIKPSDILVASNGKTIEVDNTDAEGRLILADALVYAEKLGVDAIVDLATLTGAALVALGSNIAALYSKDEKLASQIQESGKEAGEKFWRMPLEDEYFEAMKSLVADMRNIGGKYGGSITGALFLQQFVEKTAWAHLDVAGPVWSDKEKGYLNRGGTGFGVRTLVNLALAE
jgi:leucyl aminopeptidase